MESQELISNFTGLDWGIVVAYLLATVAVGLYAKRYIKDMDDYIVAGRSLKSFVSIATMLGSEIGLVTVIYTAPCAQPHDRNSYGGDSENRSGIENYPARLTAGLRI